MLANCSTLFRANFRLPIATILWLLLCVPYGHAVTYYSDAWLQHNGDGTFTIWATAVTDESAEHGVQHNVTARVSMSGPNGNPYSELTSAGQISAFVSLPAVDGTYDVAGVHSKACDSGWLGYSGIPSYVKLTVTYGLNDLGSTVVGNYRHCHYSPACSSGTPTCGSTFFTVIPRVGTLPTV